MSFRRKLMVTTLAASVAASAFAGIPLSTKGLLEKAGIQVAVANGGSAFNSVEFLERVNEFRTELAKNSTDQLAVQALRNQIRNLYLNDPVEYADAIAPLVALINEKDPNEDLLDGTDQVTLFKLIADIGGLIYDANLTELERIRTDENYRGVLEDIALAAGVTDLTVEDFMLFLFGNGTIKGLEGELKSIVLNYRNNPAALIALYEDEVERDRIFSEPIRNVLNDTNLKLSQIFNYYSNNDRDAAVTALEATIANIRADLSTEKNAILAILRTYLRLNPTTTPPTGGGGIVVPPTQTIVQQITTIGAEIANAAPGPERDALVQQAITTARAAIAEQATVQVTPVVADGKATVTVSPGAVATQLAAIREIVDALKAAAPGAEAQLNVVFTVDAGTTGQDGAEFTLPADLNEQIAELGISAVELKADGLSVQIPVEELTGEATFSVTKSPAPDDLVQSNQVVVSPVFDFQFTVSGQEITEFGKPVRLVLPVTGSDGIDTDLLTLAKIINDRLEYYGGIFTDDGFSVRRNSFSSYVVIENRVSFGDIGPVAAWAGRQIEVLAAKGAIQGRAEGTFVPRGQVTRAEFAKMLVAALQLQLNNATEGFDDVNDGDWFAPYVAAAVEQGIINGRSATRFEPNATITRAEMATMIARALQTTAGLQAATNPAAALSVFTDAADVHPTLTAGVALAAQEGLVIGSNNQFRPNATANRAEAAVIIYRAFMYEAQ